MLFLRRDENTIKLKTQTLEDLWHLEKIIKPNDRVTSRSQRKFETESRAERKGVTLTLNVEKVEFHKGFGTLRVLGTIISGKPEQYVQIGQHHSIDIAPLDTLKIEKLQWRPYELERIKEAERSAKKPKVSALIIDEREAELFSILEYGIEERGKVTTHGRKEIQDKGAQHHYFSQILELLEKVKTDKIILAGPGFEKDNFMTYLKDKSGQLAKKMIVQDIRNTGKQAIHELVSKDTLDKVMKQSRFIDEIKLVEELIAEIGRKGKATYGEKNVKEALEYGAVETLLVLDSLLFENPQRIEKLLDSAHKNKSRVMLISHENEISKKLKALTGIAALLRFQVE